jgi:trigger factor
MKSNILEQSPYEVKLEVVVETDDYSKELNNKLKEKRKTSTMKGFRPGKAPMRLIKRMYGQSLLIDIVNEKTSEAIREVNEKEGLHPIGEMEIAEEQEAMDFNPLKSQDYRFIIEMGLLPDLEIKGLDGNLSVPYFLIEASDEQINDRWKELLTQAAETVETEGPVKEGDILTLEASELEGKEEKKDGWISNFVIASDLMSEDAKEKVIGAKPGATFDFNVYELEKDATEDFVKQHLLKMDEEDSTEVNSNFRFEIMTIQAKKEAEENQETFDKIFGEGEVKSKEEALSKIRESFELANQGASDNLFYWDSKFALTDENHSSDLPDSYCKKFLLDPKTAKKYVGESLPELVKKELSWSLITQTLAKKHNIQPSQEALIEKAQERIQQMLQGQALPESVMSQLTKTILEDEEQFSNIAQEVTQNMLTQFIKDNVTLDQQAVSEEDFKKEVDRINEKVQKVNDYLTPKGGEEEE